VADGFAEVDEVDVEGAGSAFGNEGAEFEVGFFAAAFFVNDAYALKNAVDVGVYGTEVLIAGKSEDNVGGFEANAFVLDEQLNGFFGIHFFEEI